MERQAVSSSNIAEVGYDPGTEILEVLFHNGGMYHYFNVQAFMYERLIGASSVGGYFNAEIKGKYAEARV